MYCANSSSSAGPRISFGERRLLEQAMSLVTGELGEVLHTEQRDLQSELISLYSPPAKQPASTAH